MGFNGGKRTADRRSLRKYGALETQAHFKAVREIALQYAGRIEGGDNIRELPDNIVLFIAVSQLFCPQLQLSQVQWAIHIAPRCGCIGTNTFS